MCTRVKGRPRALRPYEQQRRPRAAGGARGGGAAAAPLCAAALLCAALLLSAGPAPAAARASVIPGVLPGMSMSMPTPWSNRGPVAAVAEAVKAYPAIFRTARERLMLKDAGSEADLSRANGLFSINVHDICPVIT
jgi:hypothetical protein